MAQKPGSVVQYRSNNFLIVEYWWCYAIFKFCISHRGKYERRNDECRANRGFSGLARLGRCCFRNWCSYIHFRKCAFISTKQTRIFYPCRFAYCFCVVIAGLRHLRCICSYWHPASYNHGYCGSYCRGVGFIKPDDKKVTANETISAYQNSFLIQIIIQLNF